MPHGNTGWSTPSAMSRDAPPGAQRRDPPSPFLPWAALGGESRGPGRSRARPALTVPPVGSAAQPSDRPQSHRQLCPAPEPAGSAPRVAGGQGQGAGAASRAGITGQRRCEAGSRAGSAERRRGAGQGRAHRAWSTERRTEPCAAPPELGLRSSGWQGGPGRAASPSRRGSWAERAPGGASCGGRRGGCRPGPAEPRGAVRGLSLPAAPGRGRGGGGPMGGGGGGSARGWPVAADAAVVRPRGG